MVLQMAGEPAQAGQVSQGELQPKWGKREGSFQETSSSGDPFSPWGEVSCPPQGTLIPAMRTEKTVSNQFTHSGHAGKAGDQPGQLCKGSHSGTGTPGKDKFFSLLPP